jgi:hypothetical protein
MPAWRKSLPGSVVTNGESIPINTLFEAETDYDIVIMNGSFPLVNHPRLLTGLKAGLLKLSFLKRCRIDIKN